MKRSFLSLAIGTFALGIAEFGMMGILGDVANGVGVNIVQAGHLVSSYSLGVAVGAPLLIALRRMPLRSLMVLLGIVILVGNIGSALAPDYHTLLCARFISGLPHGGFFGAGAIVCSRLATKGHGATAVSILVSGMTVANLVGVPLATFISNLFSWRFAFGGVAAFALMAVIGMRLWIPYLQPLPDTGLKGQFHFLRNRAPWLVYAGVFFGQAGVYCWFSYIDPIMTHVTGFSASAMTWVMVVAGAGMVFGNIVAGRLADRYPASVVSGVICVIIAVTMPSLFLCSHLQTPSLLLMFIATACLFGVGGPLQYLIVRYSKGGEMLGGAGIQIAFNVSNAVSASLGGLVIARGFGLSSPALVGVPFAIIGGIALFILFNSEKKQNNLRKV